MNKLIISFLNKLESKARSLNEIYRAKAFNKAASIIDKLSFEIKDISQLKKISGIGKGIRDRIQEILETKNLKEIKINDEKSNILELFMSIYGVGPKTAQRWYEKGHRNLNDILKNEKLTHTQEIGIKYIDELNLKIPRSNTDEIDLQISKAIKYINKKYKINMIHVIAGSYRRLLKASGDIDCVISEINSKLNEKHINEFIQILKSNDLITDDLGFGDYKYSGICVDKDGIHRRLDIEFVKDYITFPYELLYFTGSYNLNILMRQTAKDQGMMLNQNGLFKNGKFIQAKDEKDIFNILHMDYLPPEERN